MGWRDRLHIFRFWANKVLPQVYDDALSYYEVLNKVAAFLNETIEKMNELIQEMEDFEDDMTNKWNAFKEQMETEWAEFQEEMKDEWKAYKVLMEEIWNDFKDDINQSIQTWESETYIELVAQLQSDIATVENNLREELEAYIDGTRTVIVHVSGSGDNITADKSYTEIKSLMDSGSYILVVYNTNYFRLRYSTNTSSISWSKETHVKTMGQNFSYVSTLSFSTLTLTNANVWSLSTDDIGVIPSPSFNYDKYLKVTTNGLVWDTPESDLPAIQSGDENKVLKVNAQGTGVEWSNDESGLPAIQSGDENKVLKVNTQGTGVEWSNDESGLPTIQSGDSGKALVVNNTETGVEWATIAASDDVMIVHFEDHSYASATPPVHTCDKTFAEVKAHIESGKPVLAVHKNTFPTGQTTEGTTITLYYANSLPYTGTNPEVIEFVSNSLGVEQSGTTTDYAQCIGNIIRLNEDDTFTIITTTGYITSPHANAVGKFLKYTDIFEFEYEDVLQVPSPTASEVGKVLTAEGAGMYGWDDLPSGTELIDIGSWSSPSLPTGVTYAYIRDKLNNDINSVALIDNNKCIFRCETFNYNGVIVFYQYDTVYVVGSTTAMMYMQRLSISSNGTIDKLRVGISGDVYN